LEICSEISMDPVNLFDLAAQQALAISAPERHRR
jgi:hypothetical protein